MAEVSEQNVLVLYNPTHAKSVLNLVEIEGITLELKFTYQYEYSIPCRNSIDTVLADDITYKTFFQANGRYYPNYQLNCK